MSAPSEYDDVPFEYYYAIAWQRGEDPLFGPYRWRVRSARGDCLSCGQPVAGLCQEKERGGTSWLAHFPACPRRGWRG